MNSNLEIFTDGSHKGRWGSWAFVVVRDNIVLIENSGRERKTNSHRMEFQAAIEALKHLPEQSVATIRTSAPLPRMNCLVEFGFEVKNLPCAESPSP